MKKIRILLLMYKMQNYATELVCNLKKRGYEVDWIGEVGKIPKSKLSKKEKLIRILATEAKSLFFQKKYKKIEEKYYLDILKQVEDKYDYIIDVGSNCSITFIETLNKKIKGKKIQFIWDDLRYNKRSEDLIKYFDMNYSYCLEDSKDYNLNFRPNFYLDCFRYGKERKEYDMLYLGHMRERNRTVIVEKLYDLYNEKFKVFFKIIGKFKIKHLHRIKSKKVYNKLFLDKSFDVYELSEMYKKSKVLFDITIKTQIGLGLRPIESIGTSSKLITTNENIKKYDFYNEDNIFVLKKDFSNIKEVENFMIKPFKPYSDEIKEKYSVDGFIKDILK